MNVNFIVTQRPPLWHKKNVKPKFKNMKFFKYTHRSSNIGSSIQHSSKNQCAVRGEARILTNLNLKPKYYKYAYKNKFTQVEKQPNQIEKQHAASTKEKVIVRILYTLAAISLAVAIISVCLAGITWIYLAALIATMIFCYMPLLVKVFFQAKKQFNGKFNAHQPVIPPTGNSRMACATSW